MDNNDSLDRINPDPRGLTPFSGKIDLRSFMRHHYKPDCIRHGIRSVNLTSNSRYLIITYESSRGYIRVIDLEKLELLPHSYSGHRDSVRMVSVFKNNKYFFTASWDGTFRKYELLTGRCLQILGMAGRSPSCFLDPDDRYLYTASYDIDLQDGSTNTGRRWDLQSNEVIAFYRHSGTRKDPYCIDIACDREFTYSGSDDGQGICFETTSGKPLLTYFRCEANIRKIAISGNLYAAAATDGIVRVFNKITGEPVRQLFHSRCEVMDVRIARDEGKLWSASMDGTIRCFDLISGNTLYHKRIHKHWIWSICFCRSETVLVSGSSDGTIVFLNTLDGSILARLHCFPLENEFLFECPADPAFPNGLFYTTNRNFIEVTDLNRETGKVEILDLRDPLRTSYIDRLNLKNVVIIRMTNQSQYTAITNKYLSDSKKLVSSESHRILRGLKS